MILLWHVRLGVVLKYLTMYVRKYLHKLHTEQNGSMVDSQRPPAVRAIYGFLQHVK